MLVAAAKALQAVLMYRCDSLGTAAEFHILWKSMLEPAAGIADSR